MLPCVGIFKVPVQQLAKPPRDCRLLREPDPTFIKHLKDNMVKDPCGPGAAPLALLCKDMVKPSEFQDRFLNIYKYEVLGGLHTYLAKMQLSQELPDISNYKFVTAEVYVGLSDEQCLRLAQRHNRNSHFTHSLTHRDLV